MYICGTNLFGHADRMSPARPAPAVRTYHRGVSSPTPDAIRTALARGPATPDALAARLGGVDRDLLMWAVDELVRAGAVTSTAAGECGPDGLCATSAPTIYSLR
jgi:hypothetical protein